MRKILPIASVLLGVATCKTAPEKSSPNLVYIFPDQLRKHSLAFWDYPEFNGSIRTKADPVYTPELDNFASEGITFTRVVSNCPLCSPHRGSLMTGLYPGSSGVPLNCNSNRPISSLRTDVTTFSDVLNERGYDLAYIGKWHLDYPLPNDPANPGHYVDPRTPAWDAYTPPERRHNFNYWYSYGTWDVHKDPHYYDTDGDRFDPKEYSPKHEADKAIAYLKNRDGERNPKKPFALFVSMNPPHSPYSSTDDCMEEDYNLYKDTPLEQLLHRPNANVKMDKSKSAPYYFANVTGVDREIGRILQQLKKMNLYKNTVIVFTSDHGETLCSQNTLDPKNSIYSESFEVPFIIHYPELDRPRTENLIMSTPDIMPTILALMGHEEYIPQNIHGFNYADIIKGDTLLKRPSSALYIKNIDGEKDNNGKVLSYFPVSRGIKTERYTLELTVDQNYQLESTKFFDDDNDPYQMTNMAVNKNDPIIKNLLDELAWWLKHSDDPWVNNRVLPDWINYIK